MSKAASHPETMPVNSTTAISVLAKEKIRMQVPRYQEGSLSLQERKRQPAVWVFRYYVGGDGNRVYKKIRVGSIIEFPKRKDAEKAVSRLRVDVNAGAAFAPMNLEQLAIHYTNVELPSKAFSTREGYRNHLRNHILPQWGNLALSAIKSVAVEAWLRALKKLDGRPASAGTKSKIRNLMSAMFSHAIRYEWASTNPIASVRASSKRNRTPDILTLPEFEALVKELPQCESVMVLIAGTTGLRRSELIALRWQDVNFALNQINVTHAIWRNVEGDTKTEASHKPVPILPFVAEALRQLRVASFYGSDQDFLFPSVRMNGLKPISPDWILKLHIRPALERIGIAKRIGWHSFRHGLGTILRQKGVDLKTIQELLRHANCRITMELYLQSLLDEKRSAQELAFGGIFS
jgi:integrase